MGGDIFAGLTAFLRSVANSIIGINGVLLITIAIAGAVIGVIIFDMRVSHLYKVLILSVILLTAGAIANGLGGIGAGGAIGF